PAFFILIFSDIAYTCYLNSAYLDALSMVLLAPAVGVAIAACFRHESWLVAIAYTLAGAALIFSKSQHAVLGGFLALGAILFAWRSVSRRLRIRWIAVAVLLIGSMLSMLAVTPDSYSIFAIYSVIFARLAPHSGAPLAMLQEVGLGEEDLQYLNTHA